MDSDILAIHAAAFADFRLATGAHKREAPAYHAGRREKLADNLQTVCTIAGFFLKLARSGRQRVFAFFVIANEPSG